MKSAIILSLMGIIAFPTWLHADDSVDTALKNRMANQIYQDTSESVVKSVLDDANAINGQALRSTPYQEGTPALDMTLSNMEPTDELSVPQQSQTDQQTPQKKHKATLENNNNGVPFIDNMQ